MNFLKILKNNFDNFLKLAEKNAESPGSINVDQLMQELQSKTNHFFKVKGCTLINIKEELSKSIKFYIQINTLQFKNSAKALELDKTFSITKTFVTETEQYID